MSTKCMLALLLAALCLSRGLAQTKCWTVTIDLSRSGQDDDVKIVAQATAIRTIAADTSGAPEEDITVSDDSIAVSFENEADAAALYGRIPEWFNEMKPQIDAAADTDVQYHGSQKVTDHKNPDCNPFGSAGCTGTYISCYASLDITVIDEEPPSCDDVMKLMKCMEDKNCCDSEFVKQSLEQEGTQACRVQCNGATMRQPLQATTLIFAIFACGLAMKINGL